MTINKKNKIDQALLKMIVKDFQPYKIVEDEDYKSFIQELNPSYQIPNHHILSKVHIPALYQKLLNETNNLVRSEAVSGCITTDCWTSRNNKSYIAITFHFIDNNFTLKSVLLGCREFSENHTSVNLSDQIYMTLKEWHLENKIILTVSDNANNIKRVLSILKLKHFGCFAHTLNLVVQGALILESGLLEKIKTIVSFFHRSTSTINKLNTYQINNGAKESKKLLQDVSTRWNSTLYMIERFIELENSICGTLGLIDNSPKGLTVDEWKITKELCLVLRSFEKATRAVSGDKYMTASIVIVLSQGLKNVCDELFKHNYDPRVNDVLKKLLSGMQDKDRWNNIENSKTLVRCTFLDPQFKNVPFTESHQQQTKSDIIKLITSIISNTSDNEEQPIRISTLPNDNNKFSIWSSINSKVAQVQPVGTNTSKAIIEVQRYLEDGLQPRNTDALKWWKDNKYNYPFMSQLAKKTLLSWCPVNAFSQRLGY